VAAGNIPQVTLPLMPAGVLPVGATSFNVYLSDSAADPNTATLYASGLKATNYNMTAALTAGSPRAPIGNISTVAPVVDPAGGGSSGGNLAPGTYDVLYTFAFPDGTETLPSPASASFAVTGGAIPRVYLPPLPSGAVGVNLYLSDASATPGSEHRYATAVTASVFDLSSATAIPGTGHPLDPTAVAAPVVTATGGGMSGGSLAPGTYFLAYTFTYPSGAESLVSPNSASFTVAAGNVPEVSLPPLPDGATGYDIYLSSPSGASGTLVRYASQIRSSTLFLEDPAPTGRLSLPPTNLASLAPTVDPAGGGASGGQLLPGTYYVRFSFTYPNGAESFPSPPSATFAVAAGQVPRVTLMPLPARATGYNIYLSDAAANANSATLYAAGVAGPTFDLATNALAGRVFPSASGPVPGVPLSEAIPSVDPTAGGTTGGLIAPGTYFVFYSPTNAQGAETYLSDSSNVFTVTVGSIPRLYLPPVPDRDSGFDIYLSDSSATPGSGTIYATGVTTPTFDLLLAAHAGGASSLLAGDDITIPSPTLVLARQSATARGDHGSADPGLGTTINVDSAIVSPQVLLTGENDNDVFNVQATAPGSTDRMFTGAGTNAINLGSRQPQPFDGIVDNLQGAEILLGSGNDTANVDDTGSTAPKAGFLTAAPTPPGQNGPAGSLTGLDMSGPGVTYSGLANLNVALGPGGSTGPASPVVGNTIDIYVPAGLDLPGDTTVFGGSSDNDHVTGVWDSDHNTILNLYQFEQSTAAIGNDLTGTLNDLLPGTVQSVTIGDAMAPGSILNVGSLDATTIGPAQRAVGRNLAGTVNVLGKLGSISVAGGTPGSISAGSIGTIDVLGGYGPVAGQIKERGIQRAIDLSLPGDPYPVPNPAALPGPSANSYVNLTYLYEGLATGLGNPQLTARIDNGVGTGIDQFDFVMTTADDVAKFNLARLDATGSSGVRNVSVEGDLLAKVTPLAQQVFGLSSADGGIRLPQDQVAGVAIRDYAPPSSIQLQSIQGVAFGSTTRLSVNHVVYGTSLVPTDAASLLIQGTAIVQAEDTFLVPFADLFNQQVAFFLDDKPNTQSNQFDNADIVFTVQADGAQKENIARGAVTALIAVAKGSYVYSPNILSSIVQTIDLRDDGGSLVSRQWIAQGLTSTGPMGDISINVPLGMTDISAPSFFGNIDSYGPIAGTIQSTSLEVDPILGSTATTSADIGRAFVQTGANGQSSVTSTEVRADIQDSSSGPRGITGQLISRGNLVSVTRADGGITGVIAVQGDLGASSMILSRTSPTIVGGILAESGFSGKILDQGRIVANVSLLGGMLQGGMVAARGSILGNLTVNGLIPQGAAILSGGAIGGPHTGLAFGVDQGIIAADGPIVNLHNSPVVPPGYFASNDGQVPPPDNFDAVVLDTIFSVNQGIARSGLDLLASGDLLGLGGILNELALLHVVDNHLSLDPVILKAPVIAPGGTTATTSSDPTTGPSGTAGGTTATTTTPGGTTATTTGDDTTTNAGGPPAPTPSGGAPPPTPSGGDPTSAPTPSGGDPTPAPPPPTPPAAPPATSSAANPTATSSSGSPTPAPVAPSPTPANSAAPPAPPAPQPTAPPSPQPTVAGPAGKSTGTTSSPTTQPALKQPSQPPAQTPPAQPSGGLSIPPAGGSQGNRTPSVVAKPVHHPRGPGKLFHRRRAVQHKAPHPSGKATRSPHVPMRPRAR
jgi:hypothetical protein